MPQMATGSFKFNPEVKKSAGSQNCSQDSLCGQYAMSGVSDSRHCAEH